MTLARSAERKPAIEILVRPVVELEPALPSPIRRILLRGLQHFIPRNSTKYGIQFPYHTQ